MTASRGNGQVITFYSFKGGVGRTMALANIAWILASTGRRVLTVDWDLESPGLHRYFAPFLADRDLRQSPGVIDAITRFAQVASATVDGPGVPQVAPEEVDRLARVQGYATSLERYEFPKGGSIDFVPSGQQIAEYSHVVSNFDWEDFYTRLNGEEFLLALADDMRRNYDVALIDSRTGLSDNAGICTVTLPDTVVNCFAFNNQSIDGAVAVARSIRRLRPDGIRMFPVPTRVEDGEAAKLDRRRGLAQQRFGEYVMALGYPDPSKYWGIIEIPYKVFYAYEETLATFGDRPFQENTLLAAYERLAGELVGEDCAFAGISETVRRGWLAEFEQRGSANPGPVLICYTPRDRVWAEWISHQLRAIGQRSKLQDVGATSAAAETLAQADAIILLLSQETVRIQQTRVWWDLALKRDLPGSGRFLVPVRIDGFRLPAPYADREPVDMFNVLEQHARDALFARLDMRDAGDALDAALPGAGPRFPFEPARVWRAPARNQGFTGRDAAIEELRERLNSSTALAGPAVLQGIGGVGKTQIAIEYLHRFAADYDVVWWISADQPALVVTALADLARELELPTVTRADEQVAAVLEALRLGTPSPRWIIIFDNTDDPEKIRPLIPTGAGDVILTTPGQEWSRQAWTLDINVFDRSESVTLLTRRVPGLSADDADAIAAKLGDLPLAVEQAATWLATTAMSARSYLDILDEQLPRILNEPPPPGYRHPAAETWRLSQQRLREANPAAALLVELCAFLAPEPIPTGLLDSPGMIDVLATVNPTLRDRLLRGSLVREVARFGLARVDSAVNALRMHRLVQSVIRGDLNPEDQRIRQGQTHVILANVPREDPEDQDSWPVYGGLLAHLEPSKALESDDTEVHRLVIDVVRYLRYRGDLAGGQGLAERTLQQWVPRLGEDHASVLRMRTELANLLRQHGEYRTALEIHEDAGARLVQTLGDSHPYTLVAQSGTAADLRGLGEYRRARELDEQTVVRWQATMGDEHRRSLMSANNLATSLRLVGEFQRALLLDEDTVRRYEKALGSTHRSTLITRTNYGRDLREVGELAKAHAVLDRAWSDCRSALSESHPTTLMAKKSLAVTLRRLGQLHDARKIIEQALIDFERSLRPGHPDRLACELEMACVQSAHGEHMAAHARASEIVGRYQQVLGSNHPFTLAATNDLAMFLVRAGDHGQAAPILAHTVGRFEHVLPDHPYTLVCQLNLANARFAAGDVAAAYDLDDRCLRRLRAHFGNRSHPAILAAATNLVASRSANGDTSGAHVLQEETLRLATETLGPDHPYVEALHEGARINCDIEPLET